MVARLHICVYFVYKKGAFFVQVCIKYGEENILLEAFFLIILNLKHIKPLYVLVVKPKGLL